MLTLQAKLIPAASRLIIRLPGEISLGLPSRGIIMIAGKMNEQPFQTVLEPDGLGSHWFSVDKTLLEAVQAEACDTVTLFFHPSNNWIEPVIPADFKKTLQSTGQVWSLWQKLNPRDRWDWVRWVRSAKQEKTRAARITAACDMLQNGKKRPCCFNRTLCTVPDVSHNGVMDIPACLEK